MNQLFKLKNLLIAGLLFFLDTAIAQSYLVSYQFQQTFTVSTINQTLSDLGVPTVFIKPEFDVDVYKVIYNTRNAQDTGNTTASGVIIVPANISCPLPLASYQHGTTTRRYDVPSYGSGELTIGVIYASSGGYITAMPDYLGLGDSPGFHPYIHARSEATATIDLMRAARELSDSIGYNLNGQIFLFGYSQGGHSTMAAFKMIEEELNPEFTVTAAAPMSGPYDVSGIQAGTITSGLPYSSPSYLPYVILGYQEAYGTVYNDLSDIFIAPYDTMIPDLYDGTNSAGYIDARLPAVIGDMIDTTFYADYINNPNNIGRVLLRDNDLYQWTPIAPLRMIYCQGDEQVFAGNSEIAYDTMIARGAQAVSKIDFGNYDHGGCVQFALLDGFSFFNQYKDTKDGITINVQTTAVSGAGVQDGSIQVSATGGVAPYSYSWVHNAATDSTLSGLGASTYVVRVSDARGCYFYQPIPLTTVSSIDLSGDLPREWFRLAPNPASNQVFILPDMNLEGEGQFILRNSLGQVLRQKQQPAAQTLIWSIGDLPAGMYIVEMHYEQKVLSQKLIIKH